MIKINLALKKQSAMAGGDTKQGGGGLLAGVLGGGVGKLDFRLDGIKELPIRKIAVGLAVCLVASFGLDTYKEGEIAKVDAVVSQLRAETAKLQLDVAKIKGFEAIKKQLDADEFVLKTKIDTIEKLIADRQTPPKLLMAVSSTIPGEVWLSSLKIEKGEVTFAGGSLGFNQISDFSKNVGGNIYFTDITIKKAEGTKDDAGREFAVFEFTAKRR